MPLASSFFPARRRVVTRAVTVTTASLGVLSLTASLAWAQPLATGVQPASPAAPATSTATASAATASTAPAARVSGEKVVSVPVDGVSASAARQDSSLEAAVAPEKVQAGSNAAAPDVARKDLAVLTPVREASPFTAAGITWKYTAGVKVVEASLRVREHGKWTAWSDLEVPSLEDAAVRAKGGRDGTEPLLSLGADAVQARVVTDSGDAPQDVRVDLINGGTAAAPVSAPAAASGLAAQPKVAQAAAVVAPTAVAATRAYRPLSVAGEALRPSGIVSRAQWGAQEEYATPSTVRSQSLKAMYVHHTASSNDYTRAQAAQAVRSFYLYHTRSLDWGDIGYHFLIDKYGTIYEGRKGALNDLVLGTQAGGFNTGTIGVSMLGNYETAKPSSAGMNALRKVLAWKGYAYGLNVQGTTSLTARVSGTSTSRYKNGTAVKVPVILPHRETNNTACPGRNIVSLLPGLRKNVAADITAAIFKHGASGSPVRAVVPATAYPANQPVAIHGALNLQWKSVGYASRYQLMFREAGQQGAWAAPDYWETGATTTALSAKYTVKPGRTAVVGVRAIDAQGRPGPITRFTQATRPVGLGTTDLTASKFTTVTPLSGTSNNAGYSSKTKGATLTIKKSTGGDILRVLATAPQGATFAVKQGSTSIGTVTFAASAAVQQRNLTLPSRASADIVLTLSSAQPVTVRDLSAARPTFAVGSQPFRAAGPRLVSLKATPSNGVYGWNVNTEATRYVVEVDRAAPGQKLTGAWKPYATTQATSVTVKAKSRESVRVRVRAVSVFERHGSHTMFAAVTAR